MLSARNQQKMAPCNGEWILEANKQMQAALKAGGQLKDVAMVIDALGTGGLVGWMVDKLINLVVGWAVGDKITQAILALAIIAEYAAADRVSFKAAISLKNQCSICGFKGHNKQNCPAENGNKTFHDFVSRLHYNYFDDTFEFALAASRFEFILHLHVHSAGQGAWR